MAKVTKDVAERRPEEILNACRDLYATMSFQEISAKTSISRPSISSVRIAGRWKRLTVA